MSKKIVHIGLGAFFKAHQAWYTFRSDYGKEWQIIAFTGRSPAAAVELQEHEFKYSLLTRGPESDSLEIINSITEAYDISDVAMINKYIADKDVALVTLTITESAYNLQPNGPIAKLFGGLKARFLAGAAPIAIVPCDNLMQNGALVRNLITNLSENESGNFKSYLNEKVSVVSTSVDRITPKSEIENTVVTEPYTSWVLQGDFPLGRPNWESAGAQFVSEVAPFERRKLWLLNGAHSYLAYAGILSGYKTVAEAIGDPEIRLNMEAFWREASENLTNPNLNLEKYKSDLLERFSNARIEHKLSQIAIDGSLKLKERVVPVILGQIAANRAISASTLIIANWIQFISNTDYVDANKVSLDPIIGDSKRIIQYLSPELGNNQEFVELVDSIITEKKKAQLC